MMCFDWLNVFGPIIETTRICRFYSIKVRILDNVDLDRLPNLRARASVIAKAMIERGDARAFALGRELLSHAERV
jgi:hypothetical protein